MLNWDHERWQRDGGAELFENLCVDLLRSLDFKNVDWRKGHPDEGWDIEAKWDVRYPTGIRAELWYVQCKRYALNHGVPPTKIDTKRLEMQTQKPECFLIVTNSFFLPKVKDWAKSTVGYRVELWEREKLEELILQDGNLVEKYFPEIAETKSDLVAGVTHALRSSLQWTFSNVSYLEHLARDEKSISPDFRDHINIIEDSLLLMAREIERFHFFSALSTGVTYDFAKTFMDQMIRKSVKKFQRLAEMRGVEIQFVSIPHVTIEADRHVLEIAIDELIDNAIIYSFPNHHIEISTIQDDLNKYVQINITNFGLGILEDEKYRIFEQYYRGKAIRDPRRFIPGLGIGLAICKAVIESHGGTIEVESQPDPCSIIDPVNYRTRFTVTLPVIINRRT